VSSHRIKLARYSRGGWRQCAHLCRLAAQQPHSVWVQILLGHVGAEQDRHGIVAVDLRHNPLVPLFLLIECVELSLHVRIKVRQPLLQTWRGGAASRTSSGTGPPRVLAVCVCVFAVVRASGGRSAGRTCRFCRVCGIRSCRGTQRRRGASQDGARVRRQAGAGRAVRLGTFAIFASRWIDGSQNEPCCCLMCWSTASHMANASPRGFGNVVSSIRSSAPRAAEADYCSPLKHPRRGGAQSAGGSGSDRRVCYRQRSSWSAVRVRGKSGQCRNELGGAARRTAQEAPTTQVDATAPQARMPPAPACHGMATRAARAGADI
jgi:hypothetical protein